jgi:hypothetical protein
MRSRRLGRTMWMWEGSVSGLAETVIVRRWVSSMCGESFLLSGLRRYTQAERPPFPGQYNWRSLRLCKEMLKTAVTPGVTLRRAHVTPERDVTPGVTLCCPRVTACVTLLRARVTPGGVSGSLLRRHTAACDADVRVARSASHMTPPVTPRVTPGGVSGSLMRRHTAACDADVGVARSAPHVTPGVTHRVTPGVTPRVWRSDARRRSRDGERGRPPHERDVAACSTKPWR